MMNDVREYLKRVAALSEEAMGRLIPPQDTYPGSIHEVMRYSVFAGGKRIRPALIMASYEACGGKFGDPGAVLVCAAIEMLHTFSLIHDDLPCMDNDDFRRGRPTAHKAFNEGLAVLGGDALCIFAFECLGRTGRCDVVEEVARALGTFGMIGGQVVDIESEGKQVDRRTVEYIHANKTAALIRTCVRVGGLLARAPSDTLERLTVYGDCAGLAFQVIDDILDEEGTTEQLGKDAGSDRKKGKATFPAVAGMEESKRYAKELIGRAEQAVSFLGQKGELLRRLAQYVRTRLN
jgi:geranylgeranyl diphosphate synthase type II